MTAPATKEILTVGVIFVMLSDGRWIFYWRRRTEVVREYTDAIDDMMRALFRYADAPPFLGDHYVVLFSTVISSPGITRRIPNSDGNARLTR